MLVFTRFVHARASPPSPSQTHGQAFATIAWAFTKAYERGDYTMSTALYNAIDLCIGRMRDMQIFNARDIAQLAWSFSKANMVGDFESRLELQKRICLRAIELLQDENLSGWDGQAIANLSWALSHISSSHSWGGMFVT